MKYKAILLMLSFSLASCVTTPVVDDTKTYFSDQELVAAGATQLMGSDIVGTFAGNTLYGRYVDHTKIEQDPDANRWVEFVSGDGRVAYYDFTQLVQGTWQIRTNLICFNYLFEIPQPENCFVVYGLGDRHFFISTRQQTTGDVVTTVLGRKNGNAAGLELK